MPDLGRVFVLDTVPRGDLEEVVRAYAADPAVEYCEPDYIAHVTMLPNDPYFSSPRSWGQNFDDLWGLGRIEAPAAWDTTQGAGVTVGGTGRKIPLSTYKFPVAAGAAPAAKFYETSGHFSYADIDRDGRAEAYLYSHQSDIPWETQLQHFISFGVRTTPPRPQAPPTQPFGVMNMGSVSIADIDGDGRQELLAGVHGLALECPDCSVDYIEQYRLQSAVPVAKADGTPVSGFPKPVPVYWPEDRGGGGGLRVWVMVEDPRFVNPAVADLDGDGLKEVIWPDASSNLLFVWNVPGTPGPELGDWPMFRHDPRQTNVLPPTR